MESSIEVSIIIPTRNRKNMLRDVIKSLFNQTYPKDKYEIIVCDDGSTDGTEEIVKNMMKNAPCKLRYFKVQSKYRGPAFPRNVGIRAARGEIIGFTDDDCIVTPTWIEKAISYFRKREVGGIQGYVAPQIYKPNKIEKIFKIPRVITQTEDNGWYITANMFFRKKAIIEAGYFNPELVWGQDTDLAYRVKRQGYKILFGEDVVVYHAVQYIGYLEYFKLSKKLEFFALQLKRNPEIRKTLYLGFIFKRQHIYPIFFLFTIISALFHIDINITCSALLASLASYLWGRVFRDSHVKLYPIRIIAFWRNFVIDFISLYYTVRGAISYKCFVI